MEPETSSPPDTSDRRVELYVRSLSYPNTFRQGGCVIDRLEGLEAADVISEFDVTVWGRELELSGTTAGTETGRRLLDRFETFRRWAERESSTDDSLFEVRRVESRITGDEYTAVVLPVTVLAEFVDDDLAHVAPCSEDREVCTVDDRLDALEAGLDRADPTPEETIDRES